MKQLLATILFTILFSCPAYANTLVGTFVCKYKNYGDGSKDELVLKISKGKLQSKYLGSSFYDDYVEVYSGKKNTLKVFVEVGSSFESVITMVVTENPKNVHYHNTSVGGSLTGMNADAYGICDRI